MTGHLNSLYWTDCQAERQAATPVRTFSFFTAFPVCVCSVRLLIRSGVSLLALLCMYSMFQMATCALTVGAPVHPSHAGCCTFIKALRFMPCRSQPLSFWLYVGVFSPVMADFPCRSSSSQSVSILVAEITDCVCMCCKPGPSSICSGP